MSKRGSKLLAIGGILSVAAISWYVVSRPATPPDPTILQAAAITFYEGLPHPMYEKSIFDAEKDAKRTIDLHGYPFYRATLSLKPDDERSVKEILGSAATYEPFEGEKKCGGFHPDFAFAATISGKQHAYLICFGCGEIKVFEDGSETRYDIADAVAERLKRLLSPYRSSRPPHERFGA